MLRSDKRMFTHHRVLSNYRPNQSLHNNSRKYIRTCTFVPNSMIKINNCFETGNRYYAQNMLTRGGGGGGGVAAAGFGAS